MVKGSRRLQSREFRGAKAWLSEKKRKRVTWSNVGRVNALSCDTCMAFRACHYGVMSTLDAQKLLLVLYIFPGIVCEALSVLDIYHVISSSLKGSLLFKRLKLLGSNRNKISLDT